MRTTFKTSANGRGDSFPGFGLSGLQAIGISGYRDIGREVSAQRRRALLLNFSATRCRRENTTISDAVFRRYGRRVLIAPHRVSLPIVGHSSSSTAASKA
jgi:hypothetical protein